MPRRQEVLTWDQVMRRVSQFRPAMNRAVLQVIEAMRAKLTDAEIDDWIASGSVDELVNTLLHDTGVTAAMHQVRMQLFLVFLAGARFMQTRLPQVSQVMFDVLGIGVAGAVLRIDTKVAAAVRTEIAAVIRNEIVAAIQAGRGSKGVGPRVRAMTGLSVSQAADVARFRQALIDRDVTRVLHYARRDKSFDTLVKSKTYTAAQIAKMVRAYRLQRIALNVETITRTAALDAFKSGQQAAIEQAMQQGRFGALATRVVKTWVNMGDNKVRDEHLDGAMGGETVPWDRPYSNGDMIPGQSTWNCRCVSHFSLRPL